MVGRGSEVVRTIVLESVEARRRRDPGISIGRGGVAGGAGGAILRGGGRIEEASAGVTGRGSETTEDGNPTRELCLDNPSGSRVGSGGGARVEVLGTDVSAGSPV